jgi:serine protease Do
MYGRRRRHSQILWRKTCLLFIMGAAVGGLSSSLVYEYFSQRHPVVEPPNVRTFRATHDQLQLPSLAGMTTAAATAVVHISTTKNVDPVPFFPLPSSTRVESHSLGDEEGAGELPPHSFSESPRPREEKSSGSGFIISHDGTIVTNRHVVAGADSITVRLANEEEYEAALVGADAQTDLALVKIRAAYELPTVQFERAAPVQVGDWVIAIGNPHGLDQSVTFGIVSGTGRVLGAGPYDDFIQTDASLNPGNSGGPLLNLNGEVVGINSAILSRTGGNIGIGFATPMEIAWPVVRQLQEKGEVERGWMGVTVRAVPVPSVPSSQFGERSGVVVTGVVKDGPADQAGLLAGDIITSFNGTSITRAQQLPLLTAHTAVGDQAELTVVRSLRKRTLTVKVGKLAGRPGPGDGEGDAGRG